MASDSTSFIRKDFYLTPPTKNSAPEEWNAWLKKDNKAASVAKRAFTRSQPACELPSNTYGTTARKVNGVWKASTAIGFIGDGGESGHLEPVVEATQENGNRINNSLRREMRRELNRKSYWERRIKNRG